MPPPAGWATTAELAEAQAKGWLESPTEMQRQAGLDAEILDILMDNEMHAAEIAKQTIDYTEELHNSWYSRTYARLRILERAGMVVSRTVEADSHTTSSVTRLWRKPDTAEGSLAPDPIEELIDEWRVRAAARRAGGQNRSANEITTCIEELEAITRGR